MQLEVRLIELKAAMEGFGWWGGTVSFQISDAFTVPVAHPTPPSTAVWTVESISSWTTAVYHILFENQLKLVMIYHKMLCCKWWCVSGWLTSNTDIFAAEAGLEAVASSDVLRKAILSIKALLTELHISTSACEILCSERYDKVSEFMQTYLKIQLSGM